LPYPPSYTHIGQPLIELQTVDSTNNYALTQVHAGLAHHGWAVFSHEQLAGKGQRGKIWASSKGEAMALSIVIKPANLLVAQQFELSVCIATAVYEFFMKYAGSSTTIKWPNDLYWKDRKAGGILIENVVTSSGSGVTVATQAGNWQWAVIGIGINLNQTQFPETVPNAVSLKQITGNHLDPLELSKELCHIVDRYYNQLITKGFDDILSIYLSHFYKINEKVKLKKANRVFEAVIKGIAKDGKLIVEHAIEEQFSVGEVQWVVG
jgi:BirA family transcriptional regulator, biotin operon repressor / biotin---[acetyl-CoA-carboxylase] ligase